MKDTVLIADPNDDIREILEEQFSDKYHVLHSTDGFEACNIAMEKKSDLAGMIINIDMPTTNGIDVVTKLAADKAFENIPILVIAQDASLKNEKAAYKAGATDFNKIPFDSSLIKKKMLKYMDLFSVKEQLSEVKKQTVDQGNPSDAPLYKKMHDNMIELIGRIVEMRNPENTI